MTGARRHTHTPIGFCRRRWLAPALPLPPPLLLLVRGAIESLAGSAQRRRALSLRAPSRSHTHTHNSRPNCNRRGRRRALALIWAFSSVQCSSVVGHSGFAMLSCALLCYALPDARRLVVSWRPARKQWHRAPASLPLLLARSSRPARAAGRGGAAPSTLAQPARRPAAAAGGSSPGEGGERTLVIAAPARRRRDWKSRASRANEPR